MDIPTVLKPLFEKKKNWDYANIFIVGRPGIAVEPDTDYKIDDDGMLVIFDKEAPNPFYGRSSDPSEPRTAELTARVDPDFITSIEFLRFSKIIAAKSKIEVVK